MITIDGNGAAASVAFRTSEVIAIYPITPSSTMAEQADAWAGNGLKNVGRRTSRRRNAVGSRGHRCCTRRAANRALDLLYFHTCRFTADDPTLYKLAGQLMPFVLHVAARTVATHALGSSATIPTSCRVRQTGCAMCASSVQEAQDFALISHIATLKSRVPFIHRRLPHFA
jgi:pyruvate-ferredoxin/flavodoxin oxidoreductase